MTNVTVMKNDETTPSASKKLIERLKNEVVIQDSAGHSYTIAEPDVTAEYDLVLALGKVAENMTYLVMCAPLIYVTKIDGEAVIFPRSLSEVRALIKRVGRDGISQIRKALDEHFVNAQLSDLEKENTKK